MNQPVQATYTGYAGEVTSAEQRNRVLRNTYWLLALSMVPTVLGAWIGLTSGLARAMTPGIGLIVFLVGAFGFMYAIEKTKNSAAGVPVLLGFTLFMGLMLSRLIGMVLGMNNGAGLIMTAFTGTGVIFLGMALTAEAFDAHVPKGYIYAAMAFSLAVEVLNIRARAKRRANTPATSN